MVDQQTLLKAWYQGSKWLYLLYPLAALFTWLANRRRKRLSTQAHGFDVPVVVVGNIAVGGTGKTPIIIALAVHLKERGLKPAIISRGYGAKAPHYPYLVTVDSPPSMVGDEPLLICRESGCPVMIGADRPKSVAALIEQTGCNVILSDDGMQHYQLARQWEVCVMDGARGIGNGMCLPAGPLREPVSRLQEVDCIIVNGENRVGIDVGQTPQYTMTLTPEAWYPVAPSTHQQRADVGTCPWGDSNTLYAVTGIGNPQRFFNTLADLSLQPHTKSFPDHHPFNQSDLAYVDDQPLLMTAKDAVKCQEFAAENWWYLSVTAQLPDTFYIAFHDFLAQQGLSIEP